MYSNPRIPVGSWISVTGVNGMIASNTANLLLEVSVAGVAHVASIIGSFDPNTGIPGVIDGAVNTSKSATKEPSIKAFVYTSSSWSAANPQPNVEYSIGPDSWNDHAIKAA
ncbi:uncharacterized protein RAG0_11765 [Rhynchosporium agropyri]|uniref:Uncharacterized protein n=1 Tax=Rhynchosporium agropyri TaxID=914238 RepID=A0A1E1L5H7_9HELO|nr:uncharacterized protein RAG0_11765 [Rhynchosporium agropyri]